MGTRWSGLFTTFPVMGSIIAISSHLQYGRHAVQEAVAGMSMGLASVGAFCFARLFAAGHDRDVDGLRPGAGDLVPPPMP